MNQQIRELTAWLVSGRAKVADFGGRTVSVMVAGDGLRRKRTFERNHWLVAKILARALRARARKAAKEVPDGPGDDAA